MTIDKKYVFAYAAMFLGITNGLLYFFLGYNEFILFVWLVSLLLGGIAVGFDKRSEQPSFYLKRAEWLVPILLILVFSPVYLTGLARVPAQINEDEVWMTRVGQGQTCNDAGSNILGLVCNGSIPAGVFYLFDWLGKMVGEHNLVTMRMVHAFLGLIIIAVSYLFFRLFTSPFYAGSGSVLLGISHSFIAISRTATHHNTGLFMELIALTLLLFGFQRKNFLFMFLGGVASGLAFYFYASGRVTIILWLLFLLLSVVLSKRKALGSAHKHTASTLAVPYQAYGTTNTPFRYFFVRSLVTSLVGFILAVLPLLVANAKASIQFGFDTLAYDRGQLLFFPEGRAVGGGINENIPNGLSMFNRPLTDRGQNYYNPGHGFLDPLTGAFLLVGILFALVCIIRRPAVMHRSLFCLSSFLVLWLLYIFLINKAPNYTRLLVILPFVIYLVLETIQTLAQTAHKVVKKIFPSHVLSTEKPFAILLVGIIVLWNISIFHSYVEKRFTDGSINDEMGVTASFIEQRKNIHGYSFYLLTTPDHPYYSTGSISRQKSWVDFFISPDQHMELVDSASILGVSPQKPFAILLPQGLLEEFSTVLASQYPELKKFILIPGGKPAAIVVE